MVPGPLPPLTVTGFFVSAAFDAHDYLPASTLRRVKQFAPILEQGRQTMSDNKATARLLVCEATGVQFEYRGFGRPPKYAPGVKRPRKPRAKKADVVAA